MKKVTKRVLTSLFGAFMLLSLFTGCNNEDDVTAIFLNKTWKMSFIAAEGSTVQYDLWNGDDTSRRKSMEKLSKESNFVLNFDGSAEQGYIKGELTGRGADSTISGTWNANGESNEFSITLSKNPSESDVLGKAFLNGLKNAFRYVGDENNLYIYYKEGQTVKFMAFYPQNR